MRHFLIGSIVMLFMILIVNNKSIDDYTKCQAIEFDMPLEIEGCKKSSIKNKYCSGFCQALSNNEEEIADDEDNGNKTLQNQCQLCFPSKTFDKTITLECLRKDTSESWHLNIVIPLVEECQCVHAPCKK